MRTSAKAALLVAGSVAVALAVGEIALRAAGFSWHLRPEKVQFGWPRSLAELEGRYRTDPDLLWVRTDYEALLEQARHDQPLRLAFLGDSCTEFGRYPEILLKQLQRQRPETRWTGVNLGTTGWTSYQGMRQLERDVLPLHPKAITVYYGWNDHWIGFGLEDAQAARLLPLSEDWWSHLRLVQLGERAWVRAHQPQGELRRVPLPDFRSNLRRIVRLAKQGGTVPVLLTAPTSHLPGREPEYLRGRWLRDLRELVPLHRSYIAAVRQVAAEEKAPLCDLARDFDALPQERRDAAFQQDGIHFTALGAHRTARLLGRCLADQGVLDRIARTN
jgi:lysophospholipase L1-like esterase